MKNVFEGPSYSHLETGWSWLMMVLPESRKKQQLKHPNLKHSSWTWPVQPNQIWEGPPLLELMEMMLTEWPEDSTAGQSWLTVCSHLEWDFHHCWKLPPLAISQMLGVATSLPTEAVTSCHQLLAAFTLRHAWWCWCWPSKTDLCRSDWCPWSLHRNDMTLVDSCVSSRNNVLEMHSVVWAHNLWADPAADD